MGNNNSLGIIGGLLIGKPLGIILFCWLTVKFSKLSLPENVSWKHLTGAGVLAGIGFTMSIFISNLAFKDPQVVSYSKVAVLIASLLATIAGLAILFTTAKITEKENEGYE